MLAAHTSDNKTECLSIGVFDAADSPQKASPKVGASGQNSRHALTTPRPSTTTTDAEGQRAGREQATPWVEERWEVAGSDWNQRPPSSRSRHSSSHGSVLPSQMQTFHESRNATARPRASQEKMELKQIIQAYGDFDVTPTPQQSRIVGGIKNTDTQAFSLVVRRVRCKHFLKPVSSRGRSESFYTRGDLHFTLTI